MANESHNDCNICKHQKGDSQICETCKTHYVPATEVVMVRGTQVIDMLNDKRSIEKVNLIIVN